MLRIRSMISATICLNGVTIVLLFIYVLSSYSQLYTRYVLIEEDTGKYKVLTNSRAIELGILPERSWLTPANDEISFEDASKDDDAFTERMYTIVLYGVTHGQLKNQARKVNFELCYHHQNCRVVERNPGKTEFVQADALVLQGGKMNFRLPKHKDEDQVFVFMSKESPLYLSFTNLNDTRFLNYFNWTMTYRVHSTVPYLYGSVVPKTTLMNDGQTHDILRKRYNGSYNGSEYENAKGFMGKDYSSIFKEKSESVFWLVSHCSTASLRENYVDELRKHIDVNIIGKCNTNSTVTCEKTNKKDCERELATRYKFYLSFENSVCSDYITEKVFDWFAKDVIIVVRGARHYSRYLPKGTYIDTDDFRSPKELAKFLQTLGSNESEYTKWLKRKDEFEVFGVYTHADLAFCELCTKLNNLDKHRAVVPDINAWWNNGACIDPKNINMTSA